MSLCQGDCQNMQQVSMSEKYIARTCNMPKYQRNILLQCTTCQRSEKCTVRHETSEVCGRQVLELINTTLCGDTERHMHCAKSYFTRIYSMSW